MRVFKFYSDDVFYAYSGKDEQEAKNTLFEELGEIEIDRIEEIPEIEWDKKFIKMFEDNDRNHNQFIVSIRDLLMDEPSMIFTNDMLML